MFIIIMVLTLLGGIRGMAKLICSESETKDYLEEDMGMEISYVTRREFSCTVGLVKSSR